MSALPSPAPALRDNYMVRVAIYQSGDLGKNPVVYTGARLVPKSGDPMHYDLHVLRKTVALCGVHLTELIAESGWSRKRPDSWGERDDDDDVQEGA